METRKMKFDLPINVTVEAYNEKHAEETFNTFLSRAIKRAGLEELIQYEPFEFIAKESSCGGCGNHNYEQGQSTHPEKQTCHCASKGGSQCC